mmetsp:Transcript_52417/g.87153  ORF Transcript_52417/g.87153 Transcript_52417/m.87153 type:complete len:402 (-) Transcript_52417:64-1269(-)
MLRPLLLVLVLASFVCAESIICRDPDCGKNVTQLIQSRGYPVQEFQVQTADGYLLGVQRIPYGLNSTNRNNRPPVLLQHGLEDASHTWVANYYTYQCLAYILVEAGYDVWLGNNRGNVYSKAHVTLNPDSKEFWEFSWDEMAKYDLPAMLNFILNTTGADKVVHVGHSEGTMQGFAGYQDPSVASKVAVFVALAPVAYIGHLGSKFLVNLAKLDVAGIVSLLGFKQFLPSTALIHDVAEIACDVSDKVCNDAMCALMGCDPNNWNQTRWDVFASIDPAGTSVQNMVHFQQGANKDNWCYMDFGYFGNKDHYGHHDAPCYDLGKVNLPIALFSGGQDDLADPTDVARLKQELPASSIVYQYNINYYSHLDFIWGLDAYHVLYPQVLQVIQKYQPIPGTLSRG